MITPSAMHRAPRPERQPTHAAGCTAAELAFRDVLRSAHPGPLHSAPAQAGQAEPQPPRAGLSPEDAAMLAERFDPRRMAQPEYDELLGSLLVKGVLLESDAAQLGWHGAREPQPGRMTAADFVESRFGLSPIGTGGDYLSWAKLCALWEGPGEPGTDGDSLSEPRPGAFLTLSQALDQIQHAKR